MSNLKTEKQLIKQFLQEIEEKLPFWLKEDNDELKDILTELEDHILDKAAAIEEKGVERLEAVQLAISEMGTPSKIAHEYKRRGTPKLYITEELFPLYLTVLRYAGLIIGLITIIVTSIKIFAAALTGGDWASALGDGVFGLFITSIIAAAIITIFFTWLSYEGYFPEDIKKVFKRPEDLEKIVHPKRASIVDESLPPKTSLPPSTVKKTSKRPRGVKRPIEHILDGIFAIVMGILAIWQPITYINNKILSALGTNGVTFLNLLFIIGIFWMILGILNFVHSIFASWSFEGNRTLLSIRAIIALMTVPVLVQFLLKPEVFPVFWFSEAEGLIVFPLGTDWYWLYYLLLSLIIIGVIVSAIYKIYCAIRLEEEDFFEEYTGTA
ncbi:MAG: permease prefix domain 1-containing protein [Candidatus Helarchaeota archaeon]